MPTETQKQVLKNTLKQVKKTLPFDEIIRQGKRTYRIKPVTGNYDKSKMFDASRPLNKHKVGRGYLYTKGIWYVAVYKDGRYRTFDIGVLLPYEGGGYDRSYSPITIKEEITRQFGTDFYEEWRTFANSRFSDLKELLQYVRNDIRSIHLSVWCCGKSKNLVKRLGMPVIGDWVGLTPAGYQ